MAKNRGNKFATMLHNNTNKITLILIYAMLEWILISLLLLNSFLSYFIIKFAQYFGLNPPCFSCARIDENESFRYHLCEFHSKEASQKAFSRQKSGEFHELCENCSSPVSGFGKKSRNFVFSKVERIDVIQIDGENEVNLNCSSCGGDFENKSVDESFCFVNLVDDQIEKKCLDDGIEDDFVEENRENESEKKSSDDEEEHETEEPEIEVIRELNSFEENLIRFDKGEDLNSHDFKFFIHYSGNQLFPFEVLDSKTEEHGNNIEDHEILDSKTEGNQLFPFEVLDSKTEEQGKNVEDHEILSSKTEENQLFPFEVLDSKTEEHGNNAEDHEILDSKTEGNGGNIEDEDHEFGDFQKAHVNFREIDYSVHDKTEESVKFVENLIDFGNEEVEIDEETQIPPIELEEVQESDSYTHSVHDEDDVSIGVEIVENLIDFGNEEVEIDEETQIPPIKLEEVQESDSDIHSIHEEDDVSIGEEIPVLDSFEEMKHQIHLEHSSSFNNLLSNLENDFQEAYSSKNVEEFDEEIHPETPSSIHSLNPFHKKWLDHEAKESRVEESFDGSVISETDGVDLVNTTEELKAVLQAERKALKDLYSELEEERNASMVATNETMAMINRLQEEKSEMHMEALQYQRMMEEQMEYDQEALELLNELMMKKEKELESYRKKVLDYEAKEKIRFSQRSTKTGTSSISWSHSEDEDRLSMDLYQIPKDENTFDRNRENLGLHTPVNSVLDLASLANFEEERMSILEELKLLEEKLFTLSKEEDRHFANIGVIEDHYEEINKAPFNTQVTESTSNELANNEKQPMGKRVLPLSDSISVINEDGVTVRNGVMVKTIFHPIKFEETAVTRFELEKKRIDMEEEVDQLYRRLQALEADREFLKHCFESTKKGDKGMELLQEILHHLRDLRNVNIRAKNYVDNTFL